MDRKRYGTAVIIWFDYDEKVIEFTPGDASIVSSCTGLYDLVRQGNIVLAGNNEDWKDPWPMMFFYPATEEKYGWIKFGWGGGFPQGGMNDQGLF